MKRLLLPQGELAQICGGEDEIHYIAYAELQARGTRGNHYHEFKKESLYIISGEILLWVQDIDSNVRDSIPLRAGELAVIGTRVAHALQIVTPGHAIEYSPEKFDPADVYPFRLIE
jgi:mannose-6-phosphate isomerase-like protein (cupin superfamily)